MNEYLFHENLNAFVPAVKLSHQGKESVVLLFMWFLSLLCFSAAYFQKRCEKRNLFRKCVFYEMGKVTYST